MMSPTTFNSTSTESNHKIHLFPPSTELEIPDTSLSAAFISNKPANYLRILPYRRQPASSFTAILNPHQERFRLRTPSFQEQISKDTQTSRTSLIIVGDSKNKASFSSTLRLRSEATVVVASGPSEHRVHFPT